MPIIECSVPSLISDCTGGKSRFTLEADTLEEALILLQNTYPLLRVHLFTETGAVRKHVLLFYNEDNLAWIDTYNIPLKRGDRLTVLQAVSGG
ncbi:molybdopterin converting factor small subunit [Paenibacillus castaneae]|uniref:MoaD/ThiS family protein n=1 Tax=Paenibacillus castaneae TaxID=474957 RepID=UPI000C9C92F0|nr:MoaD/ThiS family protein [Paenibacillus castaneae]NIK75164.1 molybdopterin converting factor small subunit [Paenibacillus castaneae]